MARRAEKPFNNPFVRPNVRAQLRLVIPPVRAQPVSKPKVMPSTAPAPLTPEDERRLWAEAVCGGTPLSELHRGARVARRPQVVREVVERDPDDEAFAELVRFVSGDGVFDLADQDEFVEGGCPGLDPTVLLALRAGELSVQRYVDLHGRFVAEARDELWRFLRQARLEALRCVLVVHGRGRHSKDRVPVLKEKVVQWLSRGSMSRQILAFCTARPHDGGAGAMYVLLRRHGGG